MAEKNDEILSKLNEIYECLKGAPGEEGIEGRVRANSNEIKYMKPHVLDYVKLKQRAEGVRWIVKYFPQILFILIIGWFATMGAMSWSIIQAKTSIKQIKQYTKTADAIRGNDVQH